MSVLQVTGARVRFGGVVAVDGVDLHVAAGETVGLIGPNGAGKTTLIDAISGFVPADGTMRLAGTDVTRWPPHRRARAGLARSFQTLELFEDLTVRDNLRVAARRHRWWSPITDLVLPGRSIDDAVVVDVLDRLDLGSLADHLPTELSHGQRNLVSAARALCTSPSVVLLDEPAAGLDTDETGLLAARVRAIAEAGIGVLLVDHDMSLVLAVCDRIAVLDHGRVIAAGAPDEVRRAPAVVAAYLGAPA